MDSPSSLANAARLHSSGDLLGARRQAEDVLAFEPNNLNALRMVGVLYCQTGEPGTGAQFLREALRRDPKDDGTRLNLIQALLETGQAAEADKFATAASAQQTPQLLRARAAIAKQLGRLDDAVGLLERAAKSAPADFSVWNNLGNALHEADQPERAVEALQRAAKLQPQAAFVHVNLGKALATAGRHEESRQAFQKAAELDPDDSSAAFELGKLLLRQGLADQALPLLGRAAHLDRQNPNIFVVIGLCFARLNDQSQAENAYRVALQVGPHCGAAYLNLAILLERANRTDELKALLEQAVANGVTAGEAEYVEALVQRREGNLEKALELARRAKADALDPTLRAQFIGEVADRLGLVDVAFASFVEKNRITASRPDALPFNGTERWKTIEGMTRRTTREWFDSWRPAEPPADRSPAFLVGFLRSGTTLLDTILMGHPQTHVTEEEPMLARVEDFLGPVERMAELDQAGVEALRERYFKALPAPVPDGKLLIDKNPLATLRTPLIHRMFPDARFIFAVRHPCDVVLSCFMQSLQVTEAMAAFLDLTNSAMLYDRAMTYWTKCRDVFPVKVHTIRYEDLVADVEGEMRPLLEFLELQWDERVLDHQKTASARGLIRTPSYAQVTEGIYKRASGRWERYREHLAPILPILAPWVERFGYEPIEL